MWRVTRNSAASLVFAGVIPLFACSSATEPDGEGPVVNLLPGTGFEGRLAFLQLTREGPENNITGVALFVADGSTGDVSRVRWWRDRDQDAYLEGITWDPDGQSLTYGFGVHTDSPVQEPFHRLHRINADGSDEHPLAARTDVREAFPVWSPVGKLTYHFDGTYDGQDRWNEIFVDTKPFFDCRLPDADQPYRCEATRPAWSPDGRYLVVSMLDATTQGALYRLTVDDGTLVPLRQSTGAYNSEIFVSPIYSPDGDHIAFVRSLGDGGSEVWVLDGDGSNPRQLTSGFADRHPAWSPDGRGLAFTRMAMSPETRGHTGVWIMSGPTMTELTQITAVRTDYLTWR